MINQPHNKYQDKVNELLKQYGLSGNEISKIISIFKFEELKKGDKFLLEGKKSNRIGLLLDGLLIAYYTNQSGEKNISRFYYSPENLIVVDFESFIQDTKSNECIEAFEDTYLVIIEKDDLYDLYKEFPILNNVGRYIAEESYIKALRKIKLLQTANAKGRIIELQNQSPELFTKLPSSYIASYLGMHRNTYNKAINKK